MKRKKKSDVYDIIHQPVFEGCEVIFPIILGKTVVLHAGLVVSCKKNKIYLINEHYKAPHGFIYDQVLVTKYP